MEGWVINLRSLFELLSRVKYPYLKEFLFHFFYFSSISVFSKIELTLICKLFLLKIQGHTSLIYIATPTHHRNTSNSSTATVHYLLSQRHILPPSSVLLSILGVCLFVLILFLSLVSFPCVWNHISFLLICCWSILWTGIVKSDGGQ